MPRSPKKNGFARGKHAPAFTLVEILVAMSLAGLIVAISGRVALQMAETRNSVHHKNARMERPAALESVIAEDFARLLPVDPKNKPPMVVVEGSALILEIPVLAAVSTDGESLHTPLKPCLIRYWRHQENNARYGIEREMIDFTNPAHVFAKERIANGCEGFDVAIRRKGEWTDTVTVSLFDAKEVEAVRVRAHWADDPVGWQQTFRIEHAK